MRGVIEVYIAPVHAINRREKVLIHTQNVGVLTPKRIRYLLGKVGFAGSRATRYPNKERLCAHGKSMTQPANGVCPFAGCVAVGPSVGYHRLPFGVRTLSTAMPLLAQLIHNS